MLVKQQPLLDYAAILELPTAITGFFHTRKPDVLASGFAGDWSVQP
jgi:hypothetical protein